jgi:hypothetical protein
MLTATLRLTVVARDSGSRLRRRGELPFCHSYPHPPVSMVKARGSENRGTITSGPPYRARTKGKVERFIDFLRYSFCVPLTSQLRAAGLTLDVETANQEVPAGSTTSRTRACAARPTRFCAFVGAPNTPVARICRFPHSKTNCRTATGTLSFMSVITVMTDITDNRGSLSSSIPTMRSPESGAEHFAGYSITAVVLVSWRLLQFTYTWDPQCRL